LALYISLAQTIYTMKIFISGASGLLGGNCLKVFKEQTDWDVLGTYFSYPTDDTVYFNTLDEKDEKNVDIREFAPDVIVHCGALTHVDYCEENVEESYQKTVQSTINLLKLAKELNARLVFISTDYVFDGTKGPYSEDDEVNPLSVYGKHKLEAEEIVQKEYAEKTLIMRVTTVYGEEVRGKNFVARMIANALKDEEVAFPLHCDQYATPANAWDIARAMKHLLQDGKTGIYHIGSTDWVNRIQLTDIILKHFPDHNVFITPVFTKNLNQPAKRPLLGGLISKKFMDEYPNFKFSNVDDFVIEHINN